MVTWIVTRDWDSELEVREMSSANLPSRVGHGNWAKMMPPDPDTLPYTWRVLDDDGHIYYQGKADQDGNGPDGDEIFMILDWAAADVGASTIEFLQPDGSWGAL